MIATASAGTHVSISGLGSKVPDRIVTNDELATFVDTSDEWIVEPGDVLTLECEFTRVRGPIAKGEGRALVGDELAAQAVLTVFVGE